jgi:hypothetical protein
MTAAKTDLYTILSRADVIKAIARTVFGLNIAKAVVVSEKTTVAVQNFRAEIGAGDRILPLLHLVVSSTPAPAWSAYISSRSRQAHAAWWATAAR